MMFREEETAVSPFTLPPLLHGGVVLVLVLVGCSQPRGWSGPSSLPACLASLPPCLPDYLACLPSLLAFSAFFACLLPQHPFPHTLCVWHSHTPATVCLASLAVTTTWIVCLFPCTPTFPILVNVRRKICLSARLCVCLSVVCHFRVGYETR